MVEEVPKDTPQSPPTVLTKEMIDKLKQQLDQMEGKEISEGSNLVHKPGTSEAAWYIAYSTSA